MKKYGAHLTAEDRSSIEMHLNKRTPLNKISEQENLNPRTISKEVKKRRILKIDGRRRNICGNQNNCEYKHLCDDCNSENGKCRFCTYRNCNDICGQFSETPICKTVMRFPHVCNGCDILAECKLPKFIYFAHIAHESYVTQKTAWRCHRKFSDEDLSNINDLLAPYINNGHSLQSAIHHSEAEISVSTAYKFAREGLFKDVKLMDMPFNGHYATKQKKKRSKRKQSSYIEGRDMLQYAYFLTNEYRVNTWEMDVVIGEKTKNQACILTLLHEPTNLQLLFKLNAHTSDEVTKVFEYIQVTLGPELYAKTFESILTDRGSEFTNPEAIEIHVETGEQLTHVFYCDPLQSNQKPLCEKNHVEIRKMVPKGYSWNNYTIEDIEHISNMINNYGRPIMGFDSPLILAKKMLDKAVLDLNSLSELDPQEVKLKRFLK